MFKKDGLLRSSTRRLRAKIMTDEQISHLSISEIIELVKRLVDEIEIRMMELIKS